MLIYAPHVFSSSETDSNLWSVIFQILMFNLVALILGYLVERGNRQQKQMIAVEKSRRFRFSRHGSWSRDEGLA
ncbi:MAG: hypothetical protein MZV70_61165 [Desulfobacterales bacterium]|nr:hypothetical protein [Desulfobacterales bacterium]